MKIGTNQISSIYLGTNKISKAYLNGHNVYSDEPTGDPNTLLLMHFDNNMTDSSLYSGRNGISYNTGTIGYTEGKFAEEVHSSSLVYLNFSNFSDFLSDLNKNNEFTIEFWGDWANLFKFKFATSISQHCVYEARTSKDFYYGLPTNSGGTGQTGSYAVDRVNKYHIAFIWYNGVVKVYVNGTAQGTTSNLTTGFSGTLSEFSFNNIDELRISNVARWTSNFNGNLPTQPYN